MIANGFKFALGVFLALLSLLLGLFVVLTVIDVLIAIFTYNGGQS